MKTGAGRRQRVDVSIEGLVQGVGFRPFVYLLADELGLTGWVLNSGRGVSVEAEGPKGALADFLKRLEKDHPANAVIHRMTHRYGAPQGALDFTIRDSRAGAVTTIPILPDLATCPACLGDIRDPSDRRYRYPFTNCTHCGPRFTIVESLPYDRARTSMSRFPMCPRCRREYHDPMDRRFHAQPNACPDCGPQLRLISPSGAILAESENALVPALNLLRDGGILAVKGIGGYHLMVDAASSEAVARLRRRKQREAKPLALMMPSLAEAERRCRVSPLERELLTCAAAPIVLLRRGEADGVAPEVAPGNPYLGVMLPYSPLHHVLLEDLGAPLVATSGNLSEEPMCRESEEALERLGSVADLFLDHDRPILRPVDDSVVREMAGRMIVLRRARGYAPIPLEVEGLEGARDTLAVGGHLKNTAAVVVNSRAVLTQHLGDLSNRAAQVHFKRSISNLETLYKLNPRRVACDLHPDYVSTRYAEERRTTLVPVQHHYAHVLSCMAEHGLKPPVLGVAWDGTGYGTDGTIWGGEFLRIHDRGFERLGHLLPFRLPGGEQAVREPRRSAMGLMREAYGDNLADGPLGFRDAFDPEELRVLLRILERGVNSPVTTSAGRLFDGVGALLGLGHRARFEGEVAMALEHVAAPGLLCEPYPFTLRRGGTPWVLDWRPLIKALIRDIEAGRAVAEISAQFHETLTAMIVNLCEASGESTLVLTGGCFQNRILCERTVERLRMKGLKPFWHHRVPPNDGGIALGQLMAAALDKRGVCSCA